MSEKEIYICFSCDAEINQEELEQAKKKHKFKGLCKWCKDLNRSLMGGVKK